MPCTDVTEILEITLDARDRVVAYSLSKQTCGGAVAGRGLIRSWVKNKPLDEILTLSPARLVQDSRSPDELQEYLRLKHLFSIQALLGRYSGRPEFDDDSLVEVLSIDYDQSGARIRARLNLEVITEKIKACGLCGC